ncbi:MAG TPA: ribonuclease III [Anaerolineales bacterium]|nr:ribonuclease III [Anaerolineales bacterium]
MGREALPVRGWGLALPEFREENVASNSAGWSESSEEFAARLRLAFTNLSLLTRALTHRSYLNENSDALEDNERLEFLGDAVLGFVVGAWVYHHCPEMREGDLTRSRSALVRNEQLAEFARRLDLGRAMRMGRGETTSGGRNRDNLLGSTFEAVIGAIYLDQGVTAVERFMEPLLDSAKERIIQRAEICDPKSRLQEWAQAEKLGTPQYITVSSSGPDHAKVFEIEVRIKGAAYGRGRGPSKQVAEQIAAQTTLESLGLSKY